MFTQSARVYDLVYSGKDYAAEAALVHDRVAARRPDSRTLLDVACGTGRHLEQFQRWYQVVGVDLDRNLLDIAGERLPRVALHMGDMRDFELSRTFDVVTCLFSSIGYVGTPAEMERAIANMARHLNDGGVLVVEPWLTPETFQPRFPGRILVHEDATVQVVRASVARTDGRTSEIDFHYLIAEPGKIEHRTETHTMGLFTHDEYRSAFARAGLHADYEEPGPTGRGLWVCQRADGA
jgi:SAM-dependent methyltransferase